MRDDHKPATVGWLNNISREDGDMGFMSVLFKDGHFHLQAGEGDDKYTSPKPATRGDVRMFCRALGVELIEETE